MALKSKTKFREALVDAGYLEGFDYHINFEAYGRKVEGYAYPMKGKMTLNELYEAAREAEEGQFKARKQVWDAKKDPNNGRVVIQVSYFKATNWDE